jgi:peroxiredoxin
MTQLVELQKHMREFEAAGIRVYAITYDPQPALAAFAAEHGITYPLLSDEGSEVIRRFGILNTMIPADDPTRHPVTGQRFHGVPYPGTYITDENGVVTEKSFFRHHEQRISAGSILDRSLGRVLVHDEAPRDEAREQNARVSAFLSDAALLRDVASTLHVRLEMEEGFHVYAEPLPAGFIPTRVEVGPVEALEIGAPIYPPTRRREFPALGVTLPIYEQAVEIAVMVRATKELLARRPPEAPGTVTIPVAVTYQACSETVCHRPRTVRLELTTALGGLIQPDFKSR